MDRSKQLEQELETGEDIEVAWFTEKEVEQLILRADKFSEERSVAALLRFLHQPKKK